MREKRRLRLPRSAVDKRYDFAGIDHVSNFTFPWNTSFESGGPDTHTARIFGLSGLAVLPHALSMIAVCDRSALLTANLTYDHSTLALTNIAWDQHWPVTSHELGQIDSEAVAVVPGSGDVYLAAEAPAAIHKVAPWQTWQNQSELDTSRRLLPVMPEDNNLGPEGLSVPPAPDGQAESVLSVTGIEGPLQGDDPAVRRLIETDLASGAVTFEAALVVQESDPPFYLSELVLLDSGGLSSGGQMLALLRSFDEVTSSRVRLYLLDAAGADDIRHCRLVGNASAAGGACELSAIRTVQMKLLLEWTREAPLEGLLVDNYEGMSLVPPEAFGAQSEQALGGIMLLLVNDNNDNPDQGLPGIDGATQFVSFRLRFATT